MALVITIASTAEAFRFKPITESWSHRGVATSHPVERGADITDHFDNQPMTYTATLWIKEDAPGSIDIAIDETEQPKAIEARNFFSYCQGLNDGIPKILSLQTRFGPLTSMVLLSWPQTGDNYTRLPTTLEFQQIKVASSSSVKIPRRIASLQAGGQETTDKGEQSGEKVDISTAKLSRNAIVGPGNIFDRAWGVYQQLTNLGPP